jgi:hypothetical protein
LDILYAKANITEEPEGRREPQAHENAEQHTSGEWQYPASEAVRVDNEKLSDKDPIKEGPQQ